jgi:aspartate/methionine/tyrosine aminotransferase
LHVPPLDPDQVKAYNAALLKEMEVRRDILVDTVKSELGWKLEKPGGAIYAVVPVPTEIAKAFGDIDKFSVRPGRQGWSQCDFRQ